MHRLWAITSYFNPAGYSSRLANYRIFREHLSVPLLVVEMSFDGSFTLTTDDCEILLQLNGGDVMWQKERLLNIALSHLPDDCDMVAWIDCDVVFEADNWAKQITDALNRFALVHLYGHRVNLPRDLMPEDTLTDIALETPSAIYKLTHGDATDDDFRLAGAPVQVNSTVGLAWASPREVLERHNLYDACILGSADRAIVGAALGRFDYSIDALKMTGRQVDHFLAWARPYYKSVQNRVGYIQGRCFHLWHGDLRDRQYEQRLDALRQYAFDPYTDITMDDNTLWRWSSDKPELHQYVRSYFDSRNEDGRMG